MRELDQLRRIAEQTARTDAKLREQRALLRDAIRAASHAGVSLTEMGRILGVTRQRVKQLRDD